MKSNHITIRGEQIKQVLTKFYYKDSHLHFQILLEFEIDKTIALREFSNYTEYKKVFTELQRIKTNNLAFRVPKQILERII